MATVNGSRDLMMDRDLGWAIGKVGKINRLTKKGFVEMVFDDRTLYLPPGNVDLIR